MQTGGMPGVDAMIGPYRLLRVLGSGGQGVVYLARRSDGPLVALKALQEATPAFGVDAFRSEIAAVAAVEGFCTAPLLDADLEHHPPYLVSEYVDGPTLWTRVSTSGPFAGNDLQRLAIGTVTALTSIHRAGVVHRDFKPANVILGPDGPRVIDFGIARIVSGTASRTGRVMGTFAYMAPEQFEGADPAPAMDVFAWACTMVFASTGRSPFDGPSEAAVIRRVCDGEPNLDGVPAEVLPWVTAALAKDPAARPTALQILCGLLKLPPGSMSTPPVATVLSQGAQVAAAATTVVSAGPGPAIDDVQIPSPSLPSRPRGWLVCLWWFTVLGLVGIAFFVPTPPMYLVPLLLVVAWRLHLPVIKWRIFRWVMLSFLLIVVLGGGSLAAWFYSQSWVTLSGESVVVRHGVPGLDLGRAAGTDISREQVPPSLRDELESGMVVADVQDGQRLAEVLTELDGLRDVREGYEYNGGLRVAGTCYREDEQVPCRAKHDQRWFAVVESPFTVDPTRGLSATAQAFCDARATKLKLSGYVTALDSYESYSTNGQHRFACYVTTDPES